MTFLVQSNQVLCGAICIILSSIVQCCPGPMSTNSISCRIDVYLRHLKIRLFCLFDLWVNESPIGAELSFQPVVGAAGMIWFFNDGFFLVLTSTWLTLQVEKSSWRWWICAGRAWRLLSLLNWYTFLRLK